jgi:hypothetical protein
MSRIGVGSIQCPPENSAPDVNVRLLPSSSVAINSGAVADAC